jgi:hypothetical protein
MKKSMVLLAILSTLSLSVLANGNNNSNNCPGNSCHGGDATGGNSTSNATGVGIGVGYANASGGNSASTSNATVGNVSGGSAYAVGGSSDVDVRNSSTNLNTNANTNKVDSSNVQGQIQGQGQKQSTNNANNSTNSVVVEGDNFEAKRIPVNTAFAPSIAPTANCALSISGGISTIGFSGSFGKAYIDQNCADNEDIRNVALVLGDKETAEQMKCETSAAYRKARAAMNRHCAVEQE